MNWSRWLAVLFGSWAGCLWAAQFPVTDAQGLQNALPLAAVNGQADAITLAAGYFAGNLNFQSALSGSLTIQGAAGTTNTDITIDGADGGRDLNLACTAKPPRLPRFPAQLEFPGTSRILVNGRVVCRALKLRAWPKLKLATCKRAIPTHPYEPKHPPQDISQ